MAIRMIIIINASPKVAFNAIADPNKLVNWFPDNAMFEYRFGRGSDSLSKERIKGSREDVIVSGGS